MTLSFVFAVAFLANAQNQETRKLDPFTSVVIAGDIKARLVPGSTYQIDLSTEGVSPDDVTVYIKDGRLRVKLYEGLLNDDEQASITIYYKELKELRTSAGAVVVHEGVLQADTLNLRANSGSELTLEVSTNHLEAIAAEGAILYVSGHTESQDANANTGGEYLAFNFDCRHTTVSANSGGIAEVIAIERLDANANLGGTIHYQGEPDYKTTRSFLSGGIKRTERMPD